MYIISQIHRQSIRNYLVKEIIWLKVGKQREGKPVSGPGDKNVLEALMDVTLGIAACSVSESKCNGGKCSPVKVVVE